MITRHELASNYKMYVEMEKKFKSGCGVSMNDVLRGQMKWLGLIVRHLAKKINISEIEATTLFVRRKNEILDLMLKSYDFAEM